MTDTPTPIATDHIAPESAPAKAAKPAPRSRKTRAASGLALVPILHDNIAKALRGKPDQVRLALSCLMAEGHLLIEDKPGTGKTSLAKAIASSIGGTVRRVQFTPDLLPSDITGVSVFDPRSSEFSFRPGPAFTNILIADEINRASPKTQAALLEVMEERQITNDGESRPVPRPFMVVATQNPLDFHGTYPLPEVQLDRFAMRISLGYADRAAELEVMERLEVDPSFFEVKQVVSAVEFAELLHLTRQVTISQPLREYVADIVGASRRHPDLRLGVSTRGTLTLLSVSRAYALACGRPYVSPDDIKALAESVLSHRIAVTAEAEMDGVREIEVLSSILDEVPVPRRATARSAESVT